MVSYAYMHCAHREQFIYVLKLCTRAAMPESNKEINEYIIKLATG